jgi:hypothetical protein
MAVSPGQTSTLRVPWEKQNAAGQGTDHPVPSELFPPNGPGLKHGTASLPTLGTAAIAADIAVDSR